LRGNNYRAGFRANIYLVGAASSGAAPLNADVSGIRFARSNRPPTPSNSADFADTAIVYKLGTKATLMLPIIHGGGTILTLADTSPQIEIKTKRDCFLKKYIESWCKSDS
jgi:hypothetical protein